MLRSGRQSLPTPLLLKNWPRPLSDDSPSIPIDDLPSTYDEIKSHVEMTGNILIRIVTWNQEAREPPSSTDLSKLLFPNNKYHVIAVGTQECENTFAKSIIVPSKKHWEATLEAAIGTDYDVIRSHALQASHIILFVHKSMVHLISNVRSLAVPTGIGDTLGNKGGIGISFNIADSSCIFINAHLGAHQHATVRRTNEFRKISCDMVTKMLHRSDSETTSDSNSEDDYEENDGECLRNNIQNSSNSERCGGGIDYDNVDNDEVDENNLLDDGDVLPNPPNHGILYPSSQHNDDLRTDSGPKTNPLVDTYDHVFWFGDLNFRINGTREVVDGMLENHMHDALLCNDQLTMLMRFNRIFSGFAEGPLNFFPTYKFDHDSDHYDSSTRRRVPSWTDRILFKSNANTQVLSYCSAPDIRTSDHRPVYATFKSRISFSKDKEYEAPLWEIRRETKREVCCIS